jgi:hypothetical protein
VVVVTASKGLRARRSDAGQVRLTDRDARVLRWLGEQFGAPLGVVGELYGVEGRAARQNAARLERAGFASRTAVGGQQWLVPTRAGLRLAGLEYEAWAPRIFKLDHVQAVGRLRLKLEAQYPEATWTSERAIRSRWAGSGARVRFADGQLDFEVTCVGVELELHRKHPRDYEGIAADVDPAFDQVWWFVPSNSADGQGELRWLREVLAAIPKPERPEHHVIALAGELAGVLR